MISFHKYVWGKRRMFFMLLLCIMVSNCVQEFDFKTEDFESILVIKASITNEQKYHRIQLSRTYKFEDDGPLVEQGATVKVVENTNVVYIFEEIFPGTYQSTQEFSAEPNKNYQLSIETRDGGVYMSEEQVLPSENSIIDKVYPKRMFNNNGIEGVGILIDSYDVTGNSQYYRYQFEETYRITADFWARVDLTTSLEYVNRPDGQERCFNGGASNTIIITDTSSLLEDKVSGLLLRFIDAEDIRVADRYSILVRQFVQSREAYGFYNTINNFSESESLFSQLQPGFVSGNIFSTLNENERILGFFEVTSVTEKRMFFSREDLISDLPRFSPTCDRVIPRQESTETEDEFLSRLRALIRSGNVKFLEEIRDPNSESGRTYVFVPRGCGDCTVYGQSTIPDFWED
ncbi:DUF4249 domain-containing protein [Aquimarina sp. 2304DJ70-9]|uniref:DUF4249 domain-containing protein n=1 Tax=Aquimarina penaris TaxID=3231044 RepID=UPI0034618717